MVKIIIYLLMFFEINEAVSKNVTDVLPKNIDPECEYVAFFVKKGEKFVEALIGNRIRTANSHLFSAPNWIPPWGVGWPKNPKSRWTLKWYKKKNLKCTKYEKTLEYCFYRFSTSIVTSEIYKFYLGTIKVHKELGMLQNYLKTKQLYELRLLSKHVPRFELVDYLILSKCILSIKDDITSEEFKKFVVIIDNILNYEKIKFGLHLLRKKFNSIFRNLNHEVKAKNSELMALTWRPFSNNITGFAVYQHPTQKPFILPIKMDQTLHNIYQVNLNMAAYVPKEFLQSITRSNSKEQKKKMYIRMIFLMQTQKYRKFFNLDRFQSNIIGIAIPGSCKNNRLPLMNVYFKKDAKETKVKWVEYGTNYYDSSWVGYPCLLSDLTFIGRSSVIKKGYEESLKQSYCMVNYNINRTSIRWSATPVGKIMFPERVCLNQDLRIPVMDCDEKAIARKREYVSVNCFKHPVSKQTEFLYQSLVGCYRHLFSHRCSRNWEIGTGDGATYVDIQLYLLLMAGQTFGNITLSHDEFYTAVNKGVTLLSSNKRYKPMSTLNSLLHHFIGYKLLYLPNVVIVKPKLLRVTFNPYHHNVVGLVVYTGKLSVFTKSNVQLLTSKNYTKIRRPKKDILVIIEFSKEFLQQYPKEKDKGDVEAFILYDNTFQQDNRRCNSKIVWIGNFMSIPLQFKLSLASTGSKNGTKNGLTSGSFKVLSDRVAVFCTSVVKNGKDTSNKIFRFVYKDVSNADVRGSALVPLVKGEV